jgi:hypothetical protein
MMCSARAGLLHGGGNPFAPRRPRIRDRRHEDNCYCKNLILRYPASAQSAHVRQLNNHPANWKNTKTP